MKPKTKARILRRELAKPLHHIDSCVFLESTSETREGYLCKDYLNRVGIKYRGIFSMSVVGEIVCKIFSEVKTKELKDSALLLLRYLVGAKTIGTFWPSFDTLNTAGVVKETDSRVEPLDALHLSCAIAGKANTFVTTDRTLIHNRSLETKFGIRILHPREL
jgi:predicted nucleic acid-binding protein